MPASARRPHQPSPPAKPTHPLTGVQATKSALTVTISLPSAPPWPGPGPLPCLPDQFSIARFPQRARALHPRLKQTQPCLLRPRVYLAGPPVQLLVTSSYRDTELFRFSFRFTLTASPSRSPPGGVSFVRGRDTATQCLSTVSRFFEVPASPLISASLRLFICRIFLPAPFSTCYFLLASFLFLPCTAVVRA